jgi:hypothetical protein
MPSAKPGATPRRSKPSLAARFRRYWIVAVLAAAGLFVAARFAAQAEIFAAGAPTVAGNVRVPAAEIIANAALDPRANVWLLDARTIERRVEAIPYVASARLVRGVPGGAHLQIVERTPEGCVRSDVDSATIDAQQRVLQSGCAAAVVYRVHSPADFPVGSFLHDPALARLQTDARALAAGGRRLTDFGLDDYGELEAALPGGIVVRFGDDGDLGAKERLIGPILAALGTRVATVTAIDLRAPSTPVVEHRRRVEPAAKLIHSD